MYPASSTFKDYIKRKAVTSSWHGSISDLYGNTYTLTAENLAQNSGKITRRCSADKLSIGTACASELETEVYLDVDRYQLFGATVTLYFTLNEGVTTSETPITEDVPMGIYTVSECTQSRGRLKILGYDNMVKFDDEPFDTTSHLDILTPYEWLTEACTVCGVTLGATSSQISILPNGNRKTGLADVVSDITTWRDVICYLGCYLGAFAYIGRDGKLYMRQYTTTSVDTISASFRYSSDLSDYRTTYNGLHNIYKEGGVQEYVQNQNDDGLILDLGTNPFLQFTDDNNRTDALQEIIDAWNGVYYVPYESDIPAMPIYDPGDVLTFVDNQAGQYDIGAITEIVYRIGGRTHIRCTGDNPRLADSQDRLTKSVAGLSKDYSNGQEIGGKNFWLLHTQNISALTVSSTKTKVAEIDWNQTVDVQKMGFMFTCEASLSATAVIDVEINVDDSENYTFEVTERKAMVGARILSSNCGFRVTGKGEHKANVYLTVTDDALIWDDLK